MKQEEVATKPTVPSYSEVMESLKYMSPQEKHNIATAILCSLQDTSNSEEAEVYLSQAALNFGKYKVLRNESEKRTKTTK